MEETIELREIIEIILKGKWVISIVTIACILFSGILSWFILPEKFQSKAVVQIATNVQDTEILSNYISYEFTPQVFMQRIKNETIINKAFANENFITEFDQTNLTAVPEANTNLVTLSYTSNSPENAQKELITIITATKNEMNASVQNTLKELESTYKVETESLTKDIEKLINEYNTIVRSNQLPEVLILQTILNSEIVLNISEEQTKSLANVSGSLQNQLLQLQSQIKSKSEEYSKILNKYQSVNTGLESFNPDPFVRVIMEPTLSEDTSSPNKALNLAIGLVIGVMFGVSIVFFREYWRKNQHF